MILGFETNWSALRTFYKSNKTDARYSELQVYWNKCKDCFSYNLNSSSKTLTKSLGINPISSIELVKSSF